MVYISTPILFSYTCLLVFLGRQSHLWTRKDFSITMKSRLESIKDRFFRGWSRFERAARMWFRLFKDYLFIDFTFRAALLASQSYIFMLLSYTFLGMSYISLYPSGGLWPLYVEHLAWVAAVFTAYQYSKRFLGKNHKPWSFYLAFYKGKVWDSRHFNLGLAMVGPVILLNIIYLSFLVSPYVLLLTLLFTAILAPFVFCQATLEEVIGRNLLYKLMLDYGFNDLASYLFASGTFFAISHFVGMVPFAWYMPWEAWVVYFTVGVIYAEVSYHTQGIEVSSAMHTSHNLMIHMRKIASLFAVANFYFYYTAVPAWLVFVMDFAIGFTFFAGGILKDILVLAVVRQQKITANTESKGQSVSWKDWVSKLPGSFLFYFLSSSVAASFSLGVSAILFVRGLICLSRYNNVPLLINRDKQTFIARPGQSLVSKKLVDGDNASRDSLPSRRDDNEVIAGAGWSSVAP